MWTWWGLKTHREHLHRFPLPAAVGLRETKTETQLVISSGFTVKIFMAGGWITGYLYFVSKECKCYNHVTGFIDLLQNPYSLGKECRRVGPSILRDSGTEVVLIAAKKQRHRLIRTWSLQRFQRLQFSCVLTSKTEFHTVPQVQVDGADIRNQLLGLEIKLAEILDFQGPHLWTHQMLQKVVKHGDDPLSQEGVNKDAFDFWMKNNRTK